MNPYQLLFGPLWPTAQKHEQFPGRNPASVPEPASLIDLTPEDGGRKPNTWHRKDFQQNCINLLRLIARTPGLTRYGISALLGRHGHQLVSAMQGLHRCGYIHAPETVQGRAAWFITEKGNDYLKT